MAGPDGDAPIPLWQKLAGLALLAAGAAFIFFDWSRFVADFVPIDHSNIGPNLVASVVQWAIILVIAALLWPPTRRRIHRFIDRNADVIKAHVTSEHERIHELRLDAEAALHEKLDRLERKHDHIIAHHPDIPDFEP